MIRSILVTAIASLAVAGCASTGELTTGSIAPSAASQKAKRATAGDTAQPAAGSREAYCREIRRSWKPGDTAPTPEALEKRKADNIYCAG